MLMRNVYLFVWLIPFLSHGGTLWAEEAGPESPPGEEQLRYEQMVRFTLALEQIHERYVEAGRSVSYEELIDGAIAGMMSRLDPYSEFIESDSVQTFQENTRGEFGGIGVVINQQGGWVAVVSPIEGSPGWNAGLRAGDRFVDIEGESARGLSVQEAVQRLRGEPGSEVRMRILRPEENRVFSLTLTREVIRNPSVEPYDLLEDGVAYVRVSMFTDDTAQRLRRELTAMNRQDVTGLVLDLRGNPGGLLDAAVEVAGLFLPRDSLVVYTEGNEEGTRQEYRTEIRPHRLEPELAVLVNGGSASAAEIVAGALQDTSRATVIGSKTFGKASVQSLVPMPDGSALKLTTATYRTPSGREIHQRGIEPDVEVSFPIALWMRNRRGEDAWKSDLQIQRVVSLLRGEDPGEEAPDAGSGD